MISTIMGHSDVCLIDSSTSILIGCLRHGSQKLYMLCTKHHKLEWRQDSRVVVTQGAMYSVQRVARAYHVSRASRQVRHLGTSSLGRYRATMLYVRASSSASPARCHTTLRRCAYIVRTTNTHHSIWSVHGLNYCLLMVVSRPHAASLRPGRLAPRRDCLDAEIERPILCAHNPHDGDLA